MAAGIVPPEAILPVSIHLEVSHPGSILPNPIHLRESMVLRKLRGLREIPMARSPEVKKQRKIS